MIICLFIDQEKVPFKGILIKDGIPNLKRTIYNILNTDMMKISSHVEYLRIN